MQELFAEAFVQLQQDITQEAARAFTKQQHDPLAILHDLNPKKKAPPKRPRQMADPVPSSAGGFLPPVALPERLRRTQQAQQRQQQALTQRMERAAASQQSSSSTSSRNPDLSRRRQSSRKSIWNMVRDESGGGNAPTKVNTAAAATAASLQSHGGDPELAGVTCGSCSSTQVVIVGSNSSRNQDLKKGETWGTKDRADEVFTRLQCQTCGRTWNEEL
uniref:Uncharacterized protein n=1 Tax=Entomoneis paludosa TaxID=265537 RepID=A0A7S2YS12_9STRA|mmetsp:Transcript_7698/g.16066  ORF Transcript_7698/g.16066 Transcript_7698/m.16066 type:complete len:218 (+) Transcript_7698:1-654(+)